MEVCSSRKGVMEMLGGGGHSLAAPRWGSGAQEGQRAGGEGWASASLGGEGLPWGL